MDFCRFCGTGPLLPASSCPQCHKLLQDNADTSQSDLNNVPQFIKLLPDQPNSISVTESLQQTLTQRKTELAELQQTLAQFGERLHEQMEQCTSLEKQLEAYFQRLAQIQPDIRDQLEQRQAKEEDKVKASPKKDNKRYPRFLWIFPIIVVVAGLVCLADLSLIVLYSTPDHRSNFLDLSFTALGVFGGIYLAYDLLGHKLLGRLAAYVTVALIGILGAAVASTWLIAQDIAAVSPLDVLRNLSSDPTTLALGTTLGWKYTSLASFCLLSGAFIGVYGNLLTKSFQSSRLSWRNAFLLELLFCFIFWAVLFAFFDLTMRIGETSSSLALDTIMVISLGFPTAIVVRFYLIFINSLLGNGPDGKTSHAGDRPFRLDVLSWLGFWVPLSAVALLLYLMLFPKYWDNPLPMLGTYILSDIILTISTVLLIRFCRSIVRPERKTSSPWHKAFRLDVLSWLGFWVPVSAVALLLSLMFNPAWQLWTDIPLPVLGTSILLAISLAIITALLIRFGRFLYDRFFADSSRPIIINRFSSYLQDAKTSLSRHKDFLLHLLHWLGLWILLVTSIDLIIKIVYTTDIMTLADGLVIIPVAIAGAALTVYILMRLTAKGRQGRHSFGYWTILILFTLLVFFFPYLLALSFLKVQSGNQERLIIPFPTALIVGLGFALSGTLPVILKKFISHLGEIRNERFFGVVGLVFVSLAAILPKIPAILDFFTK